MIFCLLTYLSLTCLVFFRNCLIEKEKKKETIAEIEGTVILTAMIPYLGRLSGDWAIADQLENRKPKSQHSSHKTSMSGKPSDPQTAIPSESTIRLFK